MQKPERITGLIPTLRWMAGQAWKDLKSVYYANTLVWRLLKSGALIFLGLFAWAGASVLLSVRPGWTFLYFVLAYGFLLVFWGPLTHLLIVPGILKLRRSAQHPAIQTLTRHSGKINLTIFFTLVILLAMVQPGFMLLEFSLPEGVSGPDVSGSIECDGPIDGMITCEVIDGSGFDHAVAQADGRILDRADEPPYRLEFAIEEVPGSTYRIQLRAADETVLRTVVHSV